MIARKPEKTTRFAIWSSRLALFVLQLLLVAIVLHRFAGLSTPIAINLFAVALAGAVLSLLLAIAAFARIWQNGVPGTARTAFAVLVASAMLAWPAAYLAPFLSLPAINDITTDAAHPPPFIALARARPREANPPVYPGIPFALEQAAAYPDIRPLEITRPLDDTFDITRSVIEKQGWQIVREEPPGKDGAPGLIEAVDRTLVLGFFDDISIRVTGGKALSRVDVRSASRYGTYDLGRNAERIRDLIVQLRNRLEIIIPSAEEVATTKKKVRSKKKRSRARVSRRKRRLRARAASRDGRGRKGKRRKKRKRRWSGKAFSQSR